MELRHLRYFVAVAEALHFGQAAASLRIAQPSLSHQIQQLEHDVQTPLLLRTKRRVELTEAGRRFLEEARDILARVDRAAVLVRRAGAGAPQRLRIGVGYCMDTERIAAAVTAFDARHERVMVEIRTLAVPTQLAALRAERLDIGFTRPPVTDPTLNSEVLSTEALMVALPTRHRLAARDRIGLRALANESFVLVPRESVPVFHDIVVRACRDAGFVPHAPHEVDHLELLLGMVAAGRGVALVPACVRKLRHPRVVVRALRDSEATLQTALTWRWTNASALVKDFIVSARRTFAARAEGEGPRSPRRGPAAAGPS